MWDEMTKLKCENKDELKAQCNHCKSIFFAKSSSGTSHLRRHLNNCLKKVNKDINQYTIATQPSLEVVSTFLVCGKHSFRIVEKLRFRSMMSIASPNFKNTSRYTAARDVLMYYAKERDHVKEELVKALGLISLTYWVEYICITAYWVDKDWKLQKRIIRFRALFPPYDGLNIADELVLCLSQWGIDKRKFSFTLDNASYNDVMVSYLKNRFRANRALLCDGVFFQVICCAHILNLIVKTSLELVDDVVVASRYEWRNVAICKFLKVFYDITCVFSNSNYPTTNFYFRGVWKCSLVLSCAAILDPRYKLNYVQYCFNTLYGIHASDFLETILSNHRLLFDEYVKKSKSTYSSLVGSSNVPDNNPLDIYLKKPKLELNSQLDVLDYWSKSSVRYNEFSLLARDLLAIPISTVPSKSAFSMGKKVITPLRSSLKPKTIQAAICFDD
ncbi:hypothetical protein V6Z12_D13G120000 [Gossypium hirsutum]